MRAGDRNRVRRWAPALCLTFLSVLYFVSTCIRAATEKLWFDEVFTFDAAGLLPSLGTLWTALKHVDYSPPLGYMLAAGSESVFGRNEFGVRFPSILEFSIMALCMYAFFRRRLPWTYAAAGMIFTALTAAGRYSYEARPPALLLALGGIALVAWQAAAEGRGRRLALVALGLSLMAALCSHAMAVALRASPFSSLKLTRTFSRQRLDWPVSYRFRFRRRRQLFVGTEHQDRSSTSPESLTGKKRSRTRHRRLFVNSEGPLSCLSASCSSCCWCCAAQRPVLGGARLDARS